MSSSKAHDSDFYAWANEQAALIRAGKLADLDLENIAEEIESMGRSEYRELVSRLEVLLMHLLKWQFQSERRGSSWKSSIEVQRNRITEHLEENPSLRAKLNEIIQKAYRNARLEASIETGLSKALFPEQCPYSFEQIMDEQFFPS